MKTINTFLKSFIICIICSFILAFAIIGIQYTIKSYTNKKQDITMKLESPNIVEIDIRKDLLDVLNVYKVRDPEIVYCMAYLETGNFNSRLCIEDNNILGLYDSKRNEFMKFEYLSDCIIAYKEYVEYKRLDDETMFEFIDRIGYAEDPEYINKIKILLKQKFPNYGKVN